MLFAHDTEVALAFAATLVNTEGEEEGLPDQAALDELLRPWRFTGRRARDRAELRAVHELRPRLREVWHADEDRAVEIINGLLAEAGALPYLVKHDGWDYHLHATDPAAPLADRIAVETAMAMVDVIRADELSRLAVCGDDTCDGLVLDLSRNRSRRFCSTTCANRNAVAAYRARRRHGDRPV